MNALVGKTRPGDFGVDVMHLNLHKTFSTPHGGGGPGSGPVAVKKILEPFLPTPVVVTKPDGTLGLRLRPSAVHRARAHVLRQLRHARARAGLHHGQRPGRPAADHRRRRAQRQLHSQEARRRFRPAVQDADACTRWCSATALQAHKGIKTGDIAKRLIDYGFHPYTVSFPLIVHGALMIEPTESESKEELDQFIDAMKSIADEAEKSPGDHRRRAALHSPVAPGRSAAARKPILRWKPQGELVAK